MDTDTIQALFTNRMHVLRDYGRRVVKPVAREVARRERDTSETVTPSWVSKLLDSPPADAVRRLASLAEGPHDSPQGTAGDSRSSASA